jgi:hypothetical protein
LVSFKLSIEKSTIAETKHSVAIHLISVPTSFVYQRHDFFIFGPVFVDVIEHLQIELITISKELDSLSVLHIIYPASMVKITSFLVYVSSFTFFLTFDNLTTKFHMIGSLFFYFLRNILTNLNLKLLKSSLIIFIEITNVMLFPLWIDLAQMTRIVFNSIVIVLDFLFAFSYVSNWC